MQKARGAVVGKGSNRASRASHKSLVELVVQPRFARHVEAHVDEPSEWGGRVLRAAQREVTFPCVLC